MEYLGDNKQIVLVGLNPTEEALYHNAVFCQTSRIWKIISQSAINPVGVNINTIPTSEDAKGKYKNFAGYFFGPETTLGYLDLVPDVYSKKSNDVVISQEHIEKFMGKINKLKIEKIGLLGKTVTKAIFPTLADQKLEYGKLIETIKIGSTQIPVYCLPFPETVPMSTKEKASFYNMNY